jgi:hypothetical protein
MKTRLIFLVLLIACFACGTSNKPVSDAQKEKIKGEIRDIQNTTIRALEEIDWDVVTEPVFDSPDFVYTYNGKTSNYEEFMANELDFNTRLNQKCTIVDEKYAVLDNSTVLYTMNCTWLTNYKNGHSVLADPAVTQVLYKKIDNRWRVINIIDSGVEQSVKNTETSNQLNQVELNNQLIGSWKFEYGKDTIGYADFTTYGTGIDANIKHVSKGKTFMEVRIIWAYDKTLDKMIGLNQIKGGDVVLLSAQFISKNKYVFVNYKDISNPEEASWKMEGTFKSHELLEVTNYINNKPVKTITYTRVK